MTAVARVRDLTKHYRDVAAVERRRWLRRGR